MLPIFMAGILLMKTTSVSEFMPVSYTHLERSAQDQLYQIHRDFGVQNGHGAQGRSELSESALCALSLLRKRCAPVSYTHLSFF